MPAHFSRLRRWLAACAIALVVVVAAAYFYARHRVQNVLRQAPEKIGLNIQQSATGFTISKSEQGRTLFKVQASKAVQFKLGGRTELHDVEITLYGRDSSRFDRIYGKDFIYDQPSGNISAQGDVQIDLEANPAGTFNPDQAIPSNLKNPIHLKTSGLVFNHKTGDAFTKERIEFSVDEAEGSAVGVNYTAKRSVLTLQSQVSVTFHGITPASINASRGTIEKDPQMLSFDHPLLRFGAQSASANEARLFLRPNNKIDRVLASGNVDVRSVGSQVMHARADKMGMLMAENEDELRAAVFSGAVHFEASGDGAMQLDAGRVDCDFAKGNQVKKVRASETVRINQFQNPKSSRTSGNAQEFEVNASSVDFFFASGKRLERAETMGPAQLALNQVGGNKLITTFNVGGPQTFVTAGRFEAKFDRTGQIESLHGAPEARITTKSGEGKPDRTSTSDVLDVSFQEGRGVASIIQTGHFSYVDSELKATAERANYNPANQQLQLVGAPRISDRSMTITARSMRLNRATGDASADGEVKSTYTDLKPMADGALLASSGPIHITADAMTAHRSPAVAVYTGGARLWPGANVIEATTIEFDRDRRSVVAHASPPRKVSTLLLQSSKSDKVEPVTITSQSLSYADSERKAHLEGQVVVSGSGLTVTADKMDIFLQEAGKASADGSQFSTGKVDRIVASGDVLITQPGRRASGNQLVYTASDGKFVLTGGPPSIFDATHGKITGVSLTLFSRDGRVLVEGSEKSPAFTQTQVAR